MYTSGSTGNPKGVVQNQKNVLFHIFSYCEKLKLDAHDTVALFTSYGHAVAVIDILAVLFTGGTIVIHKLQESPLFNLKRWLIDEKITIYHSVPTVFRAYLNAADTDEIIPNVRFLILGGEEVTTSDLELFKSNFAGTCLFVNFFGASEVLVSCFSFTSSDTIISKNVVPIGFPIAGVKVHLLTETNGEAAVFRPGEIVYESDYLALGYWKLDKATQLAFPADLFKGGKRAYRSGDLGRLMPDGSLELLGRKDFQVKINGLRIEMGEIEAVLCRHPDITQAVVIYRGIGTGLKSLCAYYLSASKIGKVALVDFMSAILPAYMIPANFVWMDEFPLTATGKVDRNAFPEPVFNEKPGVIDPTNETEKKLIDIFSSILSINPSMIGPNADFFELGGNSLKAVLLSGRLYQVFGLKLSLQHLFKYSSVSKLAAKIDELDKKDFKPIPLADKRAFYPLSASQSRIFFLEKYTDTNRAYNIPTILKIEGTLDETRFFNALKKLIHRHEVLRTSFELHPDGPVQIIHEHSDLIVEKFALEDGHDIEISLENVKDAFVKPFDLSNAPLLRAGLATSATETYLLFDIHHIICDGASTAIMIQDFLDLYYDIALAPLTIQYKDYACWQQDMLQSTAEAQGQFWAKKLKNNTSSFALPADYARPEVFSYEGASVRFNLDKNKFPEFNNIGTKNGVTPFINYLAALNVLLYKYTGEGAIMIGSNFFGRPHVQLQPLIGYFVNQVPLLNYPSNSQSYLDFVHSVKENFLETMEYAELPFDELLKTISYERDISRNPLFDICLSFQNFGHKGLAFKNFELVPQAVDFNTAKFDLTFTITEIEDSVLLDIEYYSRIFSKATINSLGRRFEELISQINHNPDIIIEDIKFEFSKPNPFHTPINFNF
jgi:non-ribosomal peptide synthetase component F/acyl carrier protein